MLTVNLSKKDRELVHKRIVARDVTPAMLAVMSVHELADAATQRTIKNAEREALDHSTLRIATAAGPRTKMTHKGFEEVEVDGPYNPREEQRQEEDLDSPEHRATDLASLARHRMVALPHSSLAHLHTEALHLPTAPLGGSRRRRTSN